MPTNQIITKKDSAFDSRNIPVVTVTEELLGATDINNLQAPAGARNIRRGISDGKATLTYDLSVDGSAGQSRSISISATASQEPLATHPMFQSGVWAVTESEWALWKKWDKEGMPDPVPANLSDGFTKFIELSNKGITDYLQPRAVVRVTTTESSFPSMTKLGKINYPTSAPTLKGDANWLLTSVEGQSESNGNWTVTREWTSSGSNGWEEDIYN